MSPIYSGPVIILFVMMGYLVLLKDQPAHPYPLKADVHLICQSDGGNIYLTGSDSLCAGESTGQFSTEFIGADPNFIKPVYTHFMINEIEVDHAGPDTAEFVEILGPPDSSLSGYVLVFFNGNATAPPNASYRVIDLDRFKTDSCGHFLIHGPGVVDWHPGSGQFDTLISVSGGFIQNGADAIALYHKPTFGNNSSPLLTDLVDAIVYHNSAGNLDTNLLIALGQPEQYIDNLVSSLARIPDAEGDFIKDSIPSPGLANTIVPLYTYLWLLSTNDSIIQVQTGLDTPGYGGSFQITDTGSYLVSGLSVLGSRDEFLDCSFHTIQKLVNAIENGYCATLSSRHIPIRVFPPIRFLDFMPTICSSFDAMGTYRVTIRWTGPVIQPFSGPGFQYPLAGSYQYSRDSVIFITDPIPGGDSVQFQLRDPYCGNIWTKSVSQFCDYCRTIFPPDSIMPVGVCANDPFTISPVGGGVELVKPTADLFFSEYLEGSSNNKCLEIFNGTGQSIDLEIENYSIELYFNGQGIPLSIILLEGVVLPGQNFVLCHLQADSALLHRAHQTSGNLDFNGDDALILRHGDKVIDIIGQVGFDPGNQWGSGLTSTQDNTLVRNKLIFEGDTTGNNIFIPASEWVGFANNEYSNLGFHEYKATVLDASHYKFYDDPSATINDLVGIGMTYTGSLAPGSMDTLYYSATNINYGCESEPVSVVISSSPGQLVCLDKVNIALSEKDCTKTLHSSDVVKNPGHCSFIIQVFYPFGTQNYPSKNILDRSHTGQVILYQAGRQGNNCWGYLTVEDQSVFVNKCENDTLNCYAFNALPAGSLELIDPCSGVTGMVQNLAFFDSSCLSPFTGLWIRTKIISDFRSMSRICKDTVWILKSRINELSAPESIVLDCDQLRGYTPDLMIPDSMLRYQQYGIISDSYQLVPAINGIPIYPTPGIGCSLVPSYLDLIMPLCGSGYLIRRDWRITDWCKSLDTFFIQYIRVEDFKSPRPSTLKPVLTANTDLHQCLGVIRRIRPLRFNDCSELKTSIEYSYADPHSPGKITHIHLENLPSVIPTIILPAGKHKVIFKAVDECGFTATGTVDAEITDVSPPQAICHDKIRLTADPVQCWARIYAADLNNGSFDNCQSHIHLAIAELDSIQFWMEFWARQLESISGAFEYSKNELITNVLIDHWINAYIFRDYIDVGQGNKQLVLRVYEADSIPVKDPHRFPLSLHDWFCYNVYPLSRIELNHRFIRIRNDLISLPLIASPDSLKAIYQPTTGFNPDTAWFEGSRLEPLCSFNPIGTSIDFSTSCRRALFTDCMVRAMVADLFPPTAEQPEELNLLCDLAPLRYAREACFPRKDNIQSAVVDFDCRDVNKRPYREVECIIEHDNQLYDAVDPTGSAYGYYGCNKLDALVLDENGPNWQPCHDRGWRPVYCHSWLCQDQYDSTSQPDLSSLFWQPVFGPVPGDKQSWKNTFLVSDNCQVDSTSLIIKDSSVISGCGTGWITRTWKVSDLQGNRVEVTQKINLSHRSDFEVVFPSDTVIETNSPDFVRFNGGYPLVLDADCEITGISYLDQQFDLPSENGYKIVRTWIVRDWCLYNFYPGIEYGEDIIVDDRKVADPVHRTCTYRYLKDGGDGQIRYTQIIFFKNKSLSGHSKHTAAGIKFAIADSLDNWKITALNFHGANQGDNFQLFPNWPNPFSRGTTISFYTPAEGPVNLQVRDIQGKLKFRKKVLASKGVNFYYLNSKDLNPAGIYFFSIQYGQSFQTIKLVATSP